LWESKKHESTISRFIRLKTIRNLYFVHSVDSGQKALSWKYIQKEILKYLRNIRPIAQLKRLLQKRTDGMCEGRWPTLACRVKYLQRTVTNRFIYLHVPHLYFHSIIKPSLFRQAKGEREYSSYSFLTSELDGGEWSTLIPGRALPPGEDPRYPLDRSLGGLQGWSGHRGWRKILCPCRGSNPGRPVCSQTLY
jgi:hypothetical protein